MKALIAVLVTLYVSSYVQTYPLESSKNEGISRENIKKLLDELNISVPSDLLPYLLPRVRREYENEEKDKSHERSKLKEIH